MNATPERAAGVGQTTGVALSPPIAWRQTETARAVEVPEGWELLPAGVTRTLRANSLYLAYAGREKPFVYEEGGRKFVVAEMKILGAVAFKSAEVASGCGGKAGSVWAETDGPILVRRV